MRRDQKVAMWLPVIVWGLFFVLALLRLTAHGNQATHGLPDERRQRQQWAGDLLGQGYAHAGCLPAAVAGLTLASFSCEAYVEDTTTGEVIYTQETGATLGPVSGTSPSWVLVRADTSTVPAGWTCHAGTRYCHRQAASLPATPTRASIIAQLTVAGGDITAVQDLRVPASFARFGVYDITDPLYGAVGDNSADDTAAIQAALNSNAGVVVCPVGNYKITSTLTIARGVQLRGLGAAPGGVTTTSTTWRGCALNHNFNGTFINIPGISNDATGGVGATLENLILRQVFGNGASVAGVAVNVVATSDTFKASWVHVLNVNMELNVGATDDWTFNFVADADATTSTSVGGARDHRIVGGRWYCGANCTASIKLRAAANIHIVDTLLQGTNGTVLITGSDANHISYNTSLSGVQASGDLSLDRSNGTTCGACQFTNLITTANTTGTTYSGLLAAGGVSLVGGNTQTTVQSTAGHYHYGSVAQVARYSAPTGYAVTLSLAQDGTDRWLFQQASSDGSYQFVGPGGTAFETVNNNGGRTWKKADARSVITLTDGATVTVDASTGSRFYLNAGGSRTISNLSSSIVGQEVEITVRNGTGGAITTTWSANYKLAGAWVDPAAGYTRSVRFYVHDSTTFRELSRSSADTL